MKLSKNVLFLVRELKHRLRDFLGGLACLALSSAIFLLLPPWASRFIGETIRTGTSSEIAIQLFYGLAIFAVASAFSFYRIYLMTRLSHQLTADIRRRLFSHILSVPPREIDSVAGGDLVSGFSNDVQIFYESLSRVVAILIPSVLAVICFSAAMIYYNWILFLFLFVLASPLVFVTSYFGRRLHLIAGTAQARLSALTARFAEAILAARDIRSFGLEGKVQKEFGVLNRASLDAHLSRERAELTHPVVVSLSVSLGISGLIFLSLYMIELGWTNFDNLSAFLVCLGLTYPPLQEASHSVGRLAQLFSVLDRISVIMAIRPEPNSGSRAVPDDFQGGIRFEGVGFSHPGKNFRFENLNLDIAPGEKLAIMGRSGAGKSTLLEMISRYINPDSGRILLDNINISDFDLKSLRAEIGVVFQQPIMFEASLMDNLRVGRLDASDDEVMEAARLAHVAEFADHLPEKYQTRIEARGTNLSVGQVQRIAIARVFLKNPRILLLDEPTSALDNESEQAFQNALDQVSKGRTTLMIAHRMSTFRTVDRILVLDAGRVAEIGSHHDLINKDGFYSRFLQRAKAAVVQEPDTTDFKPSPQTGPA